ncbi:hypothetical protein AZO1586I_432 [Bathymodiolus thermophilus thioautotrophic gill symbiont]|uniref:Uncharacterized protein n=1 Tax=Bathymodiolus thermophilus thioautotrophic gill symbiont TaxID=2360 RepID=A0ABM8M6Y3_9GAMM|nr:hypothetical protein AZO1586I_432 [Bathymodiolus thermophilus thioautotrophic gill symbiont]CAC9486394.1 hypothetical protein [uncultured Gammaproteobacteria bacterium]
MHLSLVMVIHHHTGGLEILLFIIPLMKKIHHHTGGLEK